MSGTALFRARVLTQRLRRAEKVFARLGMTLEEAVDLFLAEVALRGDLPFSVATDFECVLFAAEQGKVWEEVLGEY
jgi:antitoxin component of RelBE/YafQ-DinJ toxin-antitoxin module